MLIQKKDMGDKLIEDLRLNYLYFKSGGKEGLPINWPFEVHENIDISDEALTNAILIRTDLSSSCLDRVDAAYAFAGGINLTAASLKESCWYKSTLDKADFSNSNAHKASFAKADMHSTIFKGANLEGANFEGAYCGKADFSNTCLVDAKFSQTGLSNSSFRNADISGTTFERCSIDSSIDLAGVIGLSKANIISITLPKIKPSDPVNLVNGHEAREYIERLVSREPVST